MPESPEKVLLRKNGIGTRLRDVVAKLGGGKPAVENADFALSTLNRYIAGESQIGLEDAADMCARAGVSLEWLATGAGEPQIPGAAASVGGDDLVGEYALIPGYDVHASAGNGSIVPSSEVPTRRLAFRQRWLQHRGLNERDLVLVFAKGDSMEPTISDNNTLMVDTSEQRAEDGGIYVIRHGEHLVVKRTQLVFGQGIRLISDNKAYPEQMVDFDAATDLQVVGRVVWIGKDV